MAKSLCANCYKCTAITKEGTDCSAAGSIVKPVFRQDVEAGLYENCMWRTRRTPSEELKLINLVCTVFQNWDETQGKRDVPIKLTAAEINAIEAQVKNRRHGFRNQIQLEKMAA